MGERLVTKLNYEFFSQSLRKYTSQSEMAQKRVENVNVGLCSDRQIIVFVLNKLEPNFDVFSMETLCKI